MKVRKGNNCAPVGREVAGGASRSHGDGQRFPGTTLVLDNAYPLEHHHRLFRVCRLRADREPLLSGSRLRFAPLSLYKPRHHSVHSPCHLERLVCYLANAGSRTSNCRDHTSATGARFCLRTLDVSCFPLWNYYVFCNWHRHFRSKRALAPPASTKSLAHSHRTS